MNPELVAAVEQLRAEGPLPADRAARLSRVAHGELVSVRTELRVGLYLGILSLTTGVGLLVKQNLERLGPVVVALGLWLMAAGCLLWVARRAPPFSWGESPSPHLAFDYGLLLAVLLTGSALAYTEVQFTPLGEAWAGHLLLMALVSGALAVRYDSRAVFSLALTTFAAWRGVSVSLLERSFWRWAGGEAVRWNAVGCGVLFLALGLVLLHTDRKPHFEPVAAHLGWIAILGALLSGTAEAGARGRAFGLALFLTGAGLAFGAFRHRRFALFVFGVLGGYVGLSRLVLAAVSGEVLAFGWLLATSGTLLVVLFLAHRRMRVPE